MTSDNGIEVDGLVREFKGGVRAVDGIHFRVEPGEIYGFLGPNGAGKSTTVLMLTTLLPPTSGTARVAGFDIVREGSHVREAIGAALQEAALDPLLTGREHLRLQTTLHGLPKRERVRRGEELLERVGLADAADRKVGGYSGGMKRRLDLALALVHSPRVLFLDEPTTGLDPQSRSDLWEEVSRLAREDGVTVMLTTQYLEEADALAERVGIIDQGRIVAEDTPEALKAEVGRPSLEVIPSDPGGCDRLATVLSRFGELLDAPAGAVAVRLERGADELAPVVRALDAESVGIEHFQLHSPSLDDVFLAKTGHKMTVEEETARGRGGARLTLLAQVGEMARRSITQTLRQPALLIPPILFPLCLLAVNVGGLDAATKLPGFPTDNYLNFAIAIPFMQGALFASINAGSSLARDVETGFLKRLALTPMQRSALLLGNLAGVMTVAALASLVYLVVGLAAGLHLDAGVGGGLVLIVLAFLVALAFASLGAWVGLRAGSGEAVQGLFPVFFVFLFLSSQALPRPLIEQDWFRTIATWNPVSYMLEGIRSVVITGWDRVALERGFTIAIVLCAIGIFGASRALQTRLVRT